MAHRVASKNGNKYWVVPGRGDGNDFILKVYPRDHEQEVVDDKQAIVGTIIWAHGYETFQVNAVAEVEINELLSEIDFATHEGHVFGCRKCGRPIVVPFPQRSGQMKCGAGHSGTYSLPLDFIFRQNGQTIVDDGVTYEVDEQGVTGPDPPGKNWEVYRVGPPRTRMGAVLSWSDGRPLEVDPDVAGDAETLRRIASLLKR